MTLRGEIATRQGPRGGAGRRRGPHLQVLLLPGEGVGQPLRGLGSVLGHLGLDGVRDFLEYGADRSGWGRTTMQLVTSSTTSRLPGPKPRVVCKPGFFPEFQG